MERISLVVGADSSNTIIDGGQNGSVVIFENGEDTTAVLKNFTIQNGYSNDDCFIITEVVESMCILCTKRQAPNLKIY